MNWLRINRIVAALMALILIGVAVRGFLGFGQSRAYDLFHLTFGLIGATTALAASGRYAPAFNLGFGLIDAYQVMAQPLGLFPTQLFNLSVLDTIQHIMVASVLIGVSLAWFVRSGKSPVVR